VYGIYGFVVSMSNHLLRKETGLEIGEIRRGLGAKSREREMERWEIRDREDKIRRRFSLRKKTSLI